MVFIGDRLYKHHTVRINYTTYDLRRNQDSINPRTHPDIMLLAPDAHNEVHPYWYARVIGVFHVNARYDGASFQRCSGGRVDVLWVRWYEFDSGYKSGWKHKRLPRLQFSDSTNPDAFGFVDPQAVLRGGHLLPAFAHGRTDEYLIPDSMARQFQVIVGARDEFQVEREDWKYYYAGM